MEMTKQCRIALYSVCVYGNDKTVQHWFYTHYVSMEMTEKCSVAFHGTHDRTVQY